MRSICFYSYFFLSVKDDKNNCKTSTVLKFLDIESILVCCKLSAASLAYFDTSLVGVLILTTLSIYSRNFYFSVSDLLFVVSDYYSYSLSVGNTYSPYISLTSISSSVYWFSSSNSRGVIFLPMVSRSIISYNLAFFLEFIM